MRPDRICGCPVRRIRGKRLHRRLVLLSTLIFVSGIVGEPLTTEERRQVIRQMEEIYTLDEALRHYRRSERWSG